LASSLSLAGDARQPAKTTAKRDADKRRLWSSRAMSPTTPRGGPPGRHVQAVGGQPQGLRGRGGLGTSTAGRALALSKISGGASRVTRSPAYPSTAPQGLIGAYKNRRAHHHHHAAGLLHEDQRLHHRAAGLLHEDQREERSSRELKNSMSKLPVKIM
jgi:hypothetical protein